MKTKQSILGAAILIMAGLTACETTPPSKSTTTSGASNTTPSIQDLAKCEQTTRWIYTPSNNRDCVAQVSTQRFKQLLVAGTTMPDPSTMPYILSDFRYDTQDDNPDIVRLGPGRANQGNIEVPVALKWKSQQPPFTKTYIFTRENGNWLVSDIVTSGQENAAANGSLASDLIKHL